MSIKKYFNRLIYICSLIKKKATGNPEELAKKLNLSRSATLEHLKEMKELGFPIKYSKRRGSYFFEEDVEIVDKLFTRKLEKGAMRKIQGGFKNIYLNNFIVQI
jgi:biotin operon repressor